MAASPDVKSDDYYRVLGLGRGASASEISSAYRRLALKYHPDKNPGGEETFKAISEAYQVLSDPQKKSNYDQFGKQGGPGNGGGSGGVSFQQADDIFKTFFGGGDPFSMFFGGENGGMPNNRPRVVFQSGGMQGGMPGGMGGMPGGMGGMPGGMAGGFPFDFGGMGMPGGRRPAAPPAPQHAMRNGTPVAVHGLARSPEHNGRAGKVAAFDPRSGRYNVEIDGSSLSLRPANLCQTCRVRIHQISNQPELNGQPCTIQNYNGETNRYQVQLQKRLASGRDIVALLPANIVLEKGLRVIVQGLSSAEFNGQMAQIIEVDTDASRYTVQCQNGKQIKIKFENVVC